MAVVLWKPIEVLAALERNLPQMQCWRLLHQQEGGETEQKERAAARGKRWLHYSSGRPDKPTAASIRERNTAVTSYYNQTTIDQAKKKNNYNELQKTKYFRQLRSPQFD